VCCCYIGRRQTILFFFLCQFISTWIFHRNRRISRTSPFFSFSKLCLVSHFQSDCASPCLAETLKGYEKTKKKKNRFCFYFVYVVRSLSTLPESIHLFFFLSLLFPYCFSSSFPPGESGNCVLFIDIVATLPINYLQRLLLYPISYSHWHTQNKTEKSEPIQSESIISLFFC
jgi:hypothetical protein